jgi:hypothetical protein
VNLGFGKARIDLLNQFLHCFHYADPLKCRSSRQEASRHLVQRYGRALARVG